MAQPYFLTSEYVSCGVMWLSKRAVYWKSLKWRLLTIEKKVSISILRTVEHSLSSHIVHVVNNLELNQG